MDKPNVFSLHRIVGGLPPGSLPHEESVWCHAIQTADLPHGEVPVAESVDRSDSEREGTHSTQGQAG
jgi:hypothetical protein